MDWLVYNHTYGIVAKMGICWTYRSPFTQCHFYLQPYAHWRGNFIPESKLVLSSFEFNRKEENCCPLIDGGSVHIARTKLRIQSNSTVTACSINIYSTEEAHQLRWQYVVAELYLPGFMLRRLKENSAEEALCTQRSFPHYEFQYLLVTSYIVEAIQVPIILLQLWFDDKRSC